MGRLQADLVPPRRNTRSVTAAEREVEAAAARLAARRARDILPARIATARLVLRAPMRGDVPELARLADNKAIHAVLSRLPNPYTRADAIAFVEIFAQRADERPYAITRDGQLLGVVGFTYAAGAPPELGYWLGEPHWGKGYMSEAVRGLLEAAFATRLYPELKARALVCNQASLRVLEKAGFRIVGEEAAADGPQAGRPVAVLRREQPRWM